MNAKQRKIRRLNEELEVERFSNLSLGRSVKESHKIMTEIKEKHEIERDNFLKIQIDLQKEEKVLRKTNRGLDEDLELLKRITKKLLEGADFKEGKSEKTKPGNIGINLNTACHRSLRTPYEFKNYYYEDLGSKKASEIITQPRVLYVNESEFIMIKEIIKKEDK